VDMVLSFTVLEEGNADRMLAELVRVTKPGGRIAVMIRALDIPWVVNVPLRPELKTKAEVPHGFVGEEGCADSSLYRRFHMAGLTQVQMFPQFAASNQPDTAQAQFTHSAIIGTFTADETEEWQASIAQAVADGTYFIAQPFHCVLERSQNVKNRSVCFIQTRHLNPQPFFFHPISFSSQPGSRTLGSG